LNALADDATAKAIAAMIDVRSMVPLSLMLS
jgi:hypothetical protein